MNHLTAKLSHLIHYVYYDVFSKPNLPTNSANFHNTVKVGRQYNNICSY